MTSRAPTPTFVDQSVAVAAASGIARRVIERREMPGGYLQLTRTPAPEHSAMQSGLVSPGR